uniref:Uncharacterized protein n=1 Tax=Lactuca sativa TaxID=4236 RepID=A0A9R1UI61_LACSA|nr:hypothetical protein LSAT_V11C900474460 [Lactuca sativa]
MYEDLVTYSTTWLRLFILNNLLSKSRFRPLYASNLTSPDLRALHLRPPAPPFISLEWPEASLGLGRRPHVKAPAIKPSLCPGTSSVALVNLVKFSLTVSPSFYLQPMIEYKSPLYLRNRVKFVRNKYFNCPKLYMLPGRSVLNHIPALPSRIVGKSLSVVILLCLGFRNPRAPGRWRCYATRQAVWNGQGLAGRMLVVGMGRLMSGWTIGVSFVQGDYWAQVTGNVGLWWREIRLLQLEVLGKPLYGLSPFGSTVVSRKPLVFLPPS